MFEYIYRIYESLSSGFLADVSYWLFTPITQLVRESIPSGSFWTGLLNDFLTAISALLFEDVSLAGLIFGSLLVIVVVVWLVRFVLSLFS